MASIATLGQGSAAHIRPSRMDRAFTISAYPLHGDGSSTHLDEPHGARFHSDLLELRLAIGEMIGMNDITESEMAALKASFKDAGCEVKDLDEASFEITGMD